jgi:hypothetical protein
MWQPKILGEVIAERTCDLRRSRHRVDQVRVSFGMPVRSKNPERGDPWWCPVRIKGPGLDRLQPIAGIDSLQALILALDYVTQTLPSHGRRMGGELVWLEERERIVFARQTLSRAAEEAVVVLLGRLKSAAEILDSGDRKSQATAKRSIQALAAIGAGIGHATATKYRLDSRRRR